MKRIICYLTLALFFLSVLPSFAGDARLVVLDSGIVKDNKTGLMWELGKSSQKFDTSSAASLYAGTLDLGGYHDWRLPTLEERWDLLQVFVLKKNNEITFSLFDSKYWTAETEKGTVPIRLGITCMCRGDQEIEYKDDGYVRAVRGPIEGSSR